MLSLMDWRPVESFMGQAALDELDSIQAAISAESKVGWAMPYGFGNEHCYRIANITLSPRDPEFTELTVYDSADASTTKLIPCHSIYDHRELLVERFEMDERLWWKMSETLDAGYFDLLVFILDEGIDPSTFFCTEVQTPEPCNFVERAVSFPI